MAGKAPTRVHNSNDFLNYQAGVVFAGANGSIYLSWGTSIDRGHGRW